MEDFRSNRFHDRTIAILPLGAHEQHGPHLPHETDALIAEAFARALIQQNDSGLALEILPVESIGYSPEHLFEPGTKSLGYQEAIERWLTIAETCHARGIKRLLLLNAHGGNSPLLTIVATEARLRFGMLAVVTHWQRFGLPPGLMSEPERHLDIHAGAIETSLMLALHPDRVRRDHLADFPSRQADMIARFRHLRAYGPHAFGWLMPDLNAQGAAGRASEASAEKGRAIFDHALKGLFELLSDMAAFDLGVFV